MNINETKAFRGNYLKKEHFPQPRVMTIARITEEQMKDLQGIESWKTIVYFKEDDRGLVLNPTNKHILVNIIGSVETDDMMGKQVELYNDITVNNPKAPKDPGGIRIRPVSDKF